MSHVSLSFIFFNPLALRMNPIPISVFMKSLAKQRCLDVTGDLRHTELLLLRLTRLLGFGGS